LQLLHKHNNEISIHLINGNLQFSGEFLVEFEEGLFSFPMANLEELGFCFVVEFYFLLVLRFLQLFAQAHNEVTMHLINGGLQLCSEFLLGFVLISSCQ
jgi:sRNA-binding regulator protein Hfq